MPESVNQPVNRDLRAARVAETEDKILRSAAELFTEHGYAGTTLAAVADHAGVGARTVYVRFGTKAALLRRTVDVAIAGDAAPVDVRGRDWFARTLNAPTAAERIDAMAHGGAAMMARAGDIMAVALQAAGVEPELAEATQAGRLATLDNYRLFWTRMAEDGLLPPGSDVGWLTETGALLGHAETYLLARQTMGWTPEAYERWLRVSFTRLAFGRDPGAQGAP
ncbi:TetR/AcrR family transcriptional regulator [Actinomadura barringtoniae]|uniref:TetR/AcrR family transcriptional regulator n=1 Tax=Actinomadura barringtoniae TaxID=1427535 RepID=A0A939TAK2_9ACTN|nr:TetR/AcrR family transcriptional regulator [Actinomadura barringtoniae]MBO2455499.1 TetR/AcrR family transcriptional regulator [Actinomadura barringtoniae]